ncbi:hypothetical protein AB4289_17315 [Vibrio cyclitrophicus]|uniref:hypothetical protein n=1 Tax=Vibrio TaxID=662 RepID=UPI000C83EB1E|nr:MULTISPECIES: hypothetical protein [Vibrio]PMG18155.1 hypothetical protein BCU96_12900 [Vibrio lentus]PMN12655.1 hypothetical protein BCT39_24130 [Vibrio lentus]TCV22124.1 hypothetical protein EDB70_11436 [Vibrio crassostreae]
MSDNNQLIQSTLHTELLSTSAKPTRYSTLSPETKRQVAVATALELIRADLSASFSYNGSARKGSDTLEDHMRNLDEYTNVILNAMDPES